MATHTFYEVKDRYGSQFGSESAKEALKFLENNPGTTLWVSEWEGEGEDLYQYTKGIEITALVKELLWA